MIKILIVFTNNYLAYSPTTLNLFYSLKKTGNQVKLIAEEPAQQFSKQLIDDPDISYINTRAREKSLSSRLKGVVVRKYGGDKARNRHSLLTPKAVNYIKEIREQKANLVIAVDFFALWCVQQLQMSAHLLSLEILENDKYYQASDVYKIDSVLIQSVERYNYLFDGLVKPRFTILPNSPVYDDFTPDYGARDRVNLIYCGSAVPEFGIFSVLDFLLDYPEYALTIKGAIPANTKLSIEKFYMELLTEKRLELNDSYMMPSELNRYVSNFRVGFAFYDFYRFEYLRRFNYYSAPSGKMYQYFNSGVPVIGNQLNGFNVIERSKCGELIKCLSSKEIKKALDLIEENYFEFAINSKKTSLDFDQEKFMDNVIKHIVK